jgi:Tol biopolymer transport system component
VLAALLVGVAAGAAAIFGLPRGSSPGSERTVALSPHAALVVRDLVTGETRVLSAGEGHGAAAPSWSPDGRRIAFTQQSCASCQPRLAVVRADGGEPRPLFLPEQERPAGPAAWSPDGRRLLLTVADELGETELLVVPLRGGAARKVSGSEDAGEAAWAPDARRIVFSREVDEEHRLFLADPRGHGVRALTGPGFSAASPDWSPDGSSIAFARLDRTYTWDVCVLTLAAGARRCLTHGRANEREPAWSPSGRALLFSSDESGGTAGRRTLHLVDAGTGRRRVLTGTSVDASAPAWSPDGTSVAFIRRALTTR